MREWLKRRGKLMRMGLITIGFAVVGLIEYVQLVQAFDLPQMMLVIPLVGALTMILLKKYSFLVPVCTIFLACAYQVLAGESNAIANLQTGARGVTIVLLECLSVLIVFELMGMAGGALIRVLLGKRRSICVRILSCLAGVILTVGPYFLLFHNPFYPLLARNKLTSYAKEHFSDNPIVEKRVYYSLQRSNYQCRVVMSDGQICTLYIREDGQVTQ